MDKQGCSVLGCMLAIIIVAILLTVGYYGLIAYGILAVIHFLQAHT